MITRKEHLDAQHEDDAARTKAHRMYYAQFVTDRIKSITRQRIGMTKLLASTDPHLNDIPLRIWDGMPVHGETERVMRAMGDYPTLSSTVCIYKEAARQLIEDDSNTTQGDTA